MARILALVLALVAGAHGFGEEPIVLKNYPSFGYCDSDLNVVPKMYESPGFNSMDMTPEDCWRMCDAEHSEILNNIEFNIKDGWTECYCQSSCPCMENVGDSSTYAPEGYLPPILPGQCSIINYRRGLSLRGNIRNTKTAKKAAAQKDKKAAGLKLMSKQ